MEIIREHIERGEVAAWDVELRGIRLTVLRENILQQWRPSFNAIRFAALAMLERPQAPTKLKRKKSPRVEWSKSHDILQDVAIRHKIDIDKVAQVLPDCHAMAMAEFEASGAPRNRARLWAIRWLAHRSAGIPHSVAKFQKHLARLENSGLDAQKIVGFDDCARLVAENFPELGFNSWDCSADLLELLREATAKRPSIRSDDVIGATVDKVIDRQSADDVVFGEWQDLPEESIELETEEIPF